MTGYLQVTTTTGSRVEAATLARGAVERRLAACAQVLGPVASTYWWQGTIEQSDEWMVVFKTTTAHEPRLTAYLRTTHSYDVPEIVATPLRPGNPDYLAWLSEETGR